ncbi:hypothetical protein HDV05_005201 [Chytridiales sp. JEL 0842]|nr:hypothetical protein HDV05_005201 [Chytridiales sp. JEL 0842]
MILPTALVTLVSAVLVQAQTSTVGTQTIGQVIRNLVNTPFAEVSYTVNRAAAAYDPSWDRGQNNVLFIPADSAYDGGNVPPNATRAFLPRVNAPAGVLFQSNHHNGNVNPLMNAKETNYFQFFMDDQNRTAIAYDDYSHGGDMASSEKDRFGCTVGDGRQLRYWTGLEGGGGGLTNTCCAIDVIQASNGVIFIAGCPIPPPAPTMEVINSNGYTILPRLIERAGFARVFEAAPKTAGQWTFYAPNDAALEPFRSQLDAMSVPELQAFLGNHLILSLVPALNFPLFANTPLTTVTGDTLRVGYGGALNGGSMQADWPYDLSAQGVHVVYISRGVFMPSAANAGKVSPALAALLQGQAPAPGTVPTPGSTTGGAAGGAGATGTATGGAGGSGTGTGSAAVTTSKSASMPGASSSVYGVPVAVLVVLLTVLAFMGSAPFVGAN